MNLSLDGARGTAELAAPVLARLPWVAGVSDGARNSERKCHDEGGRSKGAGGVVVRRGIDPSSATTRQDPQQQQQLHPQSSVVTLRVQCRHVLSLAPWGFRDLAPSPRLRSQTASDRFSAPLPLLDPGLPTCLRFSPDGKALAVSYARRGLAAWSVSHGTRLFSTLPELADVGGAAAERGGNFFDGAAALAMGGVECLSWAAHGYRLWPFPRPNRRPVRHRTLTSPWPV